MWLKGLGFEDQPCAVASIMVGNKTNSIPCYNLIMKGATCRCQCLLSSPAINVVTL